MTQTYSRSAQRALAILECVDSSPGGLSISEISRKLRIPKSTTHVIVRTLEKVGYLTLQPESHKYGIALKAYALGQGVMKALTLSDAALPGMKMLAKDTGLTVHLAVLDRDQGVYVQKVEPPGLIRFGTYVGKRIDLHCTSVGKAILAYSPEECLRLVLSRQRFIGHTRHTITSAKALLKEVRRTRQRGYAIDDEEEELGVRCLAVGVFNMDGEFKAALGVAGTISQIRPDNSASLARRLQEVAATLVSMSV